MTTRSNITDITRLPGLRPALPRSRVEAVDPAATAVGYLAGLFLAELVTVYFNARLGLILHLLLLSLLLLHASAVWGRRGHRFYLTVAFVPLIRVVSLSLPLGRFPVIYWYLFASLPLAAAVGVVYHLLRLPWRPARISLREWPLQLLIGLTGIGLGIVEYYILRPQPLLVSPGWKEAAGAGLLLLFCTGFVEEIIFRRLLQQTAVERLGQDRGILYVALLFTILHLGYNSAADLIFIFVIALGFGLIVAQTGSILGVALAHGLTNIMLFLVIPLGFGRPVSPPAGMTREIQFQAAAPLAFVPAHDLELRSGPSADYPLRASLAAGQPAQISGRVENGDWLLVGSTEAGVAGWVPSQQVSVQGSHGPIPLLKMPPPQAVVTGELQLRSGPGLKYPALAELTEAPYAITGRNQAGTWWRIERPPDLAGWVPAGRVEVLGDPAGIGVKSPSLELAGGFARRFGPWFLLALAGWLFIRLRRRPAAA